MDVTVVEHAEADRLAIGFGERRHENCAHLIAGLQRTFSKHGAGRFDHGAHLPGRGAEPRQNSGQRIGPLDLQGRNGLAEAVIGGLFLFEGRFPQDRGLRRWSIRDALPAFSQQFAPRCRRVFGSLRLGYQGGDLLRLQLLAIFIGEDAVQFDQSDIGILGAVRAVALIERGAIGVEFERIELRDCRCLGL